MPEAGLRELPTATVGAWLSVTFRPTRETATDTGSDGAHCVLIGLSHLTPSFTEEPVASKTLLPVRLAGAASVNEAASSVAAAEAA